MKRTSLLHAELSQLIASLGHGDMLVLGDAGLPIPFGANAPQRIDLAVCPGTPSLAVVLQTVLTEMQVQSATIASEALQGDAQALPAWYRANFTAAPTLVSHADFKGLCTQARAMVRTGECTPYANIILVAGVTF